MKKNIGSRNGNKVGWIVPLTRDCGRIFPSEWKNDLDNKRESTRTTCVVQRYWKISNKAEPSCSREFQLN